jgi:protoheme IX farnesyltransferase
MSQAASSIAVHSSIPAAAAPANSTLRDVAMLVRPRIAMMVLVTVVAAMGLTVAGPQDAAAVVAAPGRLAVAMLLAGTALVAASSSIANQILERATDRLMPRTARRPLAAGRMSPAVAWVWAAASLVMGSAMIVFAAGAWAAIAAGFTWALYLVAYTPMKRTTPLNTAVGAIAGAMPVAIGWCAAGGPERLAAGVYEQAVAVAALGTILYLWQFPHFMAIAWLYREQYAAAGLKMLTTVDPSGLRAAGQSMAAAMAMVPASLVLAVPTGSVRLFFAAAMLAVLYLAATIHFAIRRDDRSARRLLLASLGTLLGLLSASMLLGGRIG